MSSVQEAREKFLSMSTEEKRQFYGKKQFTVVSDIEAWDLFFQNNKDRLKQQFSSTYSGSKKPPILEKFEVNPTLNSKVCLWRGDITLLEIDAIVNAANNKMLGGGGVDGAIHRAAGSQLFDECKTLHGCETGSAKITAGYKLPARYVIHTVGPRGEIPNKLQSCYETCLRLLLENQLRSVAFPCISTGIYGYPQESAANVALHTVRKFLEKKSTLVDRVVFCLFLEEDVKIYENLMQLYFPVE